MATLKATLRQPPADAAIAVRRAAGELGWTFDENQSSAETLVFKRGASGYSWGAEYRVRISPNDNATSLLVVETTQKFSLLDWGRGKRAAHRLFEAVGADV